MEKIEFLRSVEIFEQFSHNALKHLTRMITKRSCSAGHWLYKEGDRAGKVYFVISGEFKVYQKFVLMNSIEDKLFMDNTG